MTKPYVIVSGDFVKTGGMDRANYALADHLSRRGDEVHLVAYRAEATLLARPNVRLHRVRKPLGSYTLGRPLLDRAGQRVAAELMPRGGRVVVNGGNCRWGDVNWVHHINVLDTPKPGGTAFRRFKTYFDYHAHTRAERSALAMARTLITTCEKNRDDLIARFGLPPDRIEVVYYGNDPDVFRPASPAEKADARARLGWSAERPVYLFVGALGDRRKGFDTLYAAWALLCSDPTWDANLVVVGDGAERPSWEAKAAAAGLSERITFLGFRPDVPELFRACDAHVLPSRYEGYSLVTQEAICCGLPAFVTRTAGIAERFEGELAEALLIADPDDAPALAQSLRTWRDRAESVCPALDAFSARLRGFTWDHMAERITTILDHRTLPAGSNRG